MSEQIEDKITALTIAVGRIEEILKSMNDKLDKLENSIENHADVLRKHTVEIELLKSKQAPKVHWTAILSAIAAGVALVTSYIIFVIK
jgi:archaellum component FlaC